MAGNGSDSEPRTPHAVMRAWLDHCAFELGLSRHTLTNYTRDAARYVNWLQEQGIEDLSNVTALDLESYVRYLRMPPLNLAASSATRAMVVVRGLHKYAESEGAIEKNVAQDVALPATCPMC